MRHAAAAKMSSITASPDHSSRCSSSFTESMAGQFLSFALSPSTVAARRSVTLLPRWKARAARSERDMDRSQFLRLTAAAKARGTTEFL